MVCAAVRRRFDARFLPLGFAVLAASGAYGLADRGAPFVTFGRCLSPSRDLAQLGVHLQLLRQDPRCGADELALGASPGRVMGIAVIVALPTLLLNLVATLGLVGFGLALRRLLTRVAEIVRRVWPRLPGTSRPPAQGRPRPVEPAEGFLAFAWQLDRSPVLRRGPPAWCAS